MGASVDAISIRVTGNASAAKRSLDQLCSTLGKVYSKAAPAIRGLEGVNSSLVRLTRAGNAVNTSNISRLSSSIQSLKVTSGNLKSLDKLSSSLSKFSQFNGVEFLRQSSLVASGIDRIASAARRYGTAYDGLPKSMRGLATMTRSVTKANQAFSSSNAATAASSASAASSNGVLSGSLADLISNFSTVNVAVMAVARAVKTAMLEASQYVEDQNLAAVVLEEHYESMYGFWEKAQSMMGIDAAQAIKYQGYFQELITGMGIAGSEAVEMSKQLTQLGYDLSSFENISIDDAMLKLQSGISGELEPLRRIGYDLSQARMEQDKYKLSMTGSVATMTQAEKVYLRYYEIMTQVSESHGDLARSLNSPMNQMRIFQSQVQMLARNLGFLFIPAINAVLPYLTALVKLLIQAAQAVAAFFGIDSKSWMADLSTVDTSSLEGSTAGIADNMADTASSAGKAAKNAKEFRKQLLGFDQINNITDSNSGSGAGAGGGGGGAGGGSGFKMPSVGYDFFDGLAVSKVQEAMESIQKALPFLKTALKLWKAIQVSAGVVKGFAEGIKTAMASSKFTLATRDLKLPKAFQKGYDVAVSFKESKLGQTVLKWKKTIEGRLSEVKFAFKETPVGKAAAKLGKIFAGKFSKGADLSKLGNVLGPLSKEVKAVLDMPLIGSALKAVGKFLGPLGTILSVVDLIRGGGGIFDSITQGKDVAMTDVGSVATSIIGLSAMFGPTGLLVGAVTAGVGSIAAIVYNKREEIAGFFTGVGQWADANVIQPVKAKLTGVATWFKANVVDKVGEKIMGVVAFFQQLYATASGIFTAVKIIIVGSFTTAKTAVDAKFAKPVKKFFSDIWSRMTTVFGKVSSWVGSRVITPVISKVNSLKAKVTKVFDGIKSSFTKAFSGIKAVATSVFNGVSSLISGAFSGALKSVQGLINGAIDGANKLIGGLEGIANKVGDKINMHVDIPKLQHVSFAANGGVFDKGQMFVAREAGPELVGTAGGKSAVLNNEQIVDAVSAGVAKAVAQVMGGGGSGDTEVNVRLYLDGREVIKSINRAQRKAGKTLVEVR